MRPDRSNRAALLVLALLFAEVVVFTISTIPGVREQRFDPVLDGWIQGSAYVLTALVAALGALRARDDRTTWALVAVALTFRAAAFVLFLTVIRERDPVPYPSASDVAWLAMCAVLFVALAVFARERLRAGSTGLLLDGVIGALAVMAIAAALFDGTLHDLTASGTPTDVLVTNLAYPVADALLLLVVLGVLVAFRWEPPRGVWLLGVGVAGFAVVDAIFLAQVTAGEFRPGQPIAALSLIATAMIALASWVPDPETRRSDSRFPDLAIPAIGSAGCVAVLLAGALTHVPIGAAVAASLGLVIAIGRALLGFRDVRAFAEARRDARTDELTGAANRRAFNETLEATLGDRSEERSLALLVVDLDNFKDVNDTLGHHHGDELLQLVTPRLRLALRGEDLLARIGGDEFAVVVADANAEVAASIAERLQANLRRPFAVAGREIVAEASVGIALFPDDGREGPELLKNADLAMYDAKESSAGYRFFRSERHVTSRERLETVDRLRRAIAEDELILHFQPQVALATGEVVGVEALVRWQHPEAGLLPPGRFLPQAESGGLMRALSLSVLDQAVRQCGAWRAAGRQVVVSVNLSVTNLLDVELPGQLAAMLTRYGVPGDALVVELTEDVFMADPSRGGRVVRGLRETGVRIAVDDYGTGFSSLGYLRDLRDIGQLKLDRSFIDGIAGDPRARAIVRSTVTMARELGLELVAEGVETPEDHAALVALDCEIAQGFLYARPAAAGDVAFDRPLIAAR